MNIVYVRIYFRKARVASTDKYLQLQQQQNVASKREIQYKLYNSSLFIINEDKVDIKNRLKNTIKLKIYFK